MSSIARRYKNIDRNKIITKLGDAVLIVIAATLYLFWFCFAVLLSVMLPCPIEQEYYT